MLDPAHVEWCRSMFNLLADGGVWGVPRSGVVWRKEGKTLVLDALMPWMEEMEGVITPSELHRQQEDEIDAVTRHFAAAGITVVAPPR